MGIMYDQQIILGHTLTAHSAQKSFPHPPHHHPSTNGCVWHISAFKVHNENRLCIIFKRTCGLTAYHAIRQLTAAKYDPGSLLMNSLFFKQRRQKFGAAFLLDSQKKKENCGRKKLLTCCSAMTFGVIGTLNKSG